MTLLLDGDVVGTGRVERTVPFFFSMDETLDVGVDRGTPVTEDYGTDDGFRFDGRVTSVTITAGEDALDPTDDQLLAGGARHPVTHPVLTRGPGRASRRGSGTRGTPPCGWC